MLKNDQKSLENVQLVTTATPLHSLGNYEVLNFGDCYVGCSYQESFTMTNHTDSQVVKFNWPSAGPHISFSPKVKKKAKKTNTTTSKSAVSRFISGKGNCPM